MTDDTEALLATADCTICTHPAATQIDAGLLGGTPIRTIAGQFGLSRSAVGRHRQNHLSAEAIVEAKSASDVKPLEILDVHRELTALAERLRKISDVSTRTRRLPTATAAERELRQTLETIARLQADPELAKAASRDQVQRWIAEGAGDQLTDVLVFCMKAARLHDRKTPFDELMVAALGALADDQSAEARKMELARIDQSAVRQYFEDRDRAEAAHIEAEVQRRVSAELARLAREAVPAIESAPEQLAIEPPRPPKVHRITTLAQPEPEVSEISTDPIQNARNRAFRGSQGWG